MGKSLAQSKWGRRLLFYLLYIGEGAPIGFIWWALPTQMSAAGVNTVRIAELGAILVLPWAMKLFWAPIVDILQFPKWTLRHWIFVCQLGMGLTLLPLANLSWVDDYSTIRLLLIFHAFFAATQDVAIDAWAIRTTEPNEEARINGFMQMGMLSGRWLFASGYLLMSAFLSQSTLVYCLVAVIWATSLVVVFNPDPKLLVHKTQSMLERFKSFHQQLFQILTRKVTWAGIAFAAVAGVGFHAATAILGDYFLRRGLTESDIAHFYSLNIVFLFIGSYFGGVIADRLGRRLVSGASILAIAGTVILISVLDQWTGTTANTWIYNVYQILHFEIGVFVASSYGLLMSITDKDISATQYSAFMGAVNLGESWASYGFGRAFEKTNSFAISFSIFAVLSLLALLLLPFLKRRHS